MQTVLFRDWPVNISATRRPNISKDRTGRDSAIWLTPKPSCSGFDDGISARLDRNSALMAERIGVTIPPKKSRARRARLHPAGSFLLILQRLGVFAASSPCPCLQAKKRDVVRTRRTRPL